MQGTGAGLLDRYGCRQGRASCVANGSDELEWIANPMYDSSHLICKSPSDYISLDIRKGVSIYRQFEENPETFLYVPNPALKTEVWRDFEP